MTGNANYSPAQIASLIAEARLQVHFQPIVDLQDGLIVAYEALTRVPADSPIVNLEALFRSAQHNGQSWELEALTRANAIAATAEWPCGMRLFLNCTPSVFADRRFLESLRRELGRAPQLAPESIVLEITELSDDQNIGRLTDQVQRAIAAGFQVALDDAGAGASGLNRMMTLRPQWVKLDREFVRGIDRDALRQNLVRFFVHYARMSGVQVLAEGIESATELETITSLGVRFAQGFYLGRPGIKEQATGINYISQVRSRWAAVEATLPQGNNEPTLRSVCRPAPAADAGASPDELRFTCSSPEGSGLIVTEGGHVVGWCSPRALARLSPGDATLRELMTTDVAMISGSLHLNECLSEVVRAGTDGLPDPIIVMSQDRPVGIVRLRDVLRIVGTDGRLASSGRASVTGLPGRTKADQHLAEQLEARRSPNSDKSRLHADVVFVDVRSFVAYQGRQGPRRADQLIRDLAELTSAVVLSSLPDAFVSHLGDDRFLITAPAGELRPRIEKLLAAFDEHHVQVDGDSSCPPLLALCLDGVLATATSCRDVYRLEQRLREQFRSRAPIGDGRSAGSILVSHDTAQIRGLAA